MYSGTRSQEGVYSNHSSSLRMLQKARLYRARPKHIQKKVPEARGDTQLCGQEIYRFSESYYPLLLHCISTHPSRRSISYHTNKIYVLYRSRTISGNSLPAGCGVTKGKKLFPRSKRVHIVHRSRTLSTISLEVVPMTKPLSPPSLHCLVILVETQRQQQCLMNIEKFREAGL
jgi:hypothetical protein